jgi:hypothetical protein
MGRFRYMRTGKAVTIYLPLDLVERLEASARRNYRTKTAQVVLALEKFLAEDEATVPPGVPGKAPALPSDESRAGEGAQTPKGKVKRSSGKGAKGGRIE